MDEQTLEKMFLEVQTGLEWSSDIGINTDLGRILHRLAEARYAPALPMIQPFLEHPNWGTRLDAVGLIGFHYPFSPESSLAQSFRQLLLHDPWPMVRMSAAHVLGGRSTVTDPALMTALTTDPDEDVRCSAFLALLQLHGVKWPQLRQIERQLESGEILLTVSSLEALVSLDRQNE